jgi:hypothetical protein
MRGPGRFAYEVGAEKEQENLEAALKEYIRKFAVKGFVPPALLVNTELGFYYIGTEVLEAA